MIRATSLTGENPVYWQRQQQSVWVDVESPTEEELAALGQVFAFNPLALEDALTEGQWSRFEAYPEHIFLVFRTIRDPERTTDATERVSLFWYPATDTLVTVRRHGVQYLERTWREFEPVRHGSEERLIYTLLARGAESFFTFTDTLHDRTDVLEEQMLTEHESHDFARQVFEYKRLITNVRRLVSGARESAAAFSRHALVVTTGNLAFTGQARLDGRDGFDPMAQEIALYFRDIVDTLGRAYDTLDSSREVLSSVLEAHLSVQSVRQNGVMKTLTVLSAIFLPLTFLAGVWGMNFEHQPEFQWRYGYAFAWASFITVAVSLAAYFKRRGWW